MIFTRAVCSKDRSRLLITGCPSDPLTSLDNCFLRGEAAGHAGRLGSVQAAKTASLQRQESNHGFGYGRCVFISCPSDRWGGDSKAFHFLSSLLPEVSFRGGRLLIKEVVQTRCVRARGAAVAQSVRRPVLVTRLSIGGGIFFAKCFLFEYLPAMPSVSGSCKQQRLPRSRDRKGNNCFSYCDRNFPLF